MLRGRRSHLHTARLRAPTDSYYLSSAAAYSQLQEHASAISDAQQALTIDPSFSKAYSRLGHALFSSGEYQEAVDAYEAGLKLDPNVGLPPSRSLPSLIPLAERHHEVLPRHRSHSRFFLLPRCGRRRG